MTSPLLSSLRPASAGRREPRFAIALTMAVLLAGCASGGTHGQPESFPPESSKRGTPSDVQASTQATPVVRAAPKRQSGETTSPAMKRPASPPDGAPTADQTRVRAPAESGAVSCKVKPDSVEWIHVTGDCRNGYAHNTGIARSRTGKRRYEGEFVDGAFEGRGVYDWGDGTRYEGEFRASRKHGNGVITYVSGNRYAGEFQDNTYHGSGTYQDGEGETYVGQFVAGKYNGRGTYTWPNGDVYTGEFRDGKLHGQGVYTKRGGDRYEGSFEDDEMHGIGTYHHANGDVYTGAFKNGDMSGQGVYRYADGAIYSGEFSRNKKHGRGKLTADAREVEQRWLYGVKVSSAE